MARLIQNHRFPCRINIISCLLSSSLPQPSCTMDVSTSSLLIYFHLHTWCRWQPMGSSVTSQTGRMRTYERWQQHPFNTHGPRPVRLLSSALSWVVSVDLALQLLLAKQPQPRHLCQILVYCAESNTAARSLCSPMRRGWDVLRDWQELQTLV